MTYRGHVQNGRIMLDQHPQLPEGAAVNVELVEERRTARPADSEALNASGRDKMIAALEKRGVRITVPPPPTPEVISRIKAWKPIQLPGGPLSDDIIRDRR